MRKILFYGGLITIVIFQLTGCNNKLINNSKEINLILKEDNLILEKSDDEIKEIALNWLDDERKKSIIDINNSKVEEIKYKEDYYVVSNEGSINIKDKVIYKVTFNTLAEVLGPIVIYVDKEEFEVLGTYIRK